MAGDLHVKDTKKRRTLPKIKVCDFPFVVSYFPFVVSFSIFLYHFPIVVSFSICCNIFHLLYHRVTLICNLEL